MSWVWARQVFSHLAEYVDPDICGKLVRIPVSTFDLRNSGDKGYRIKLASLIYESLYKEEDINYEEDKLSSSDGNDQTVREPVDIFDDGCGNCLDLALLFCGACLHYELIPLLVVFTKRKEAGEKESHALVLVSATHDRRSSVDRRPLLDQFRSFDDQPFKDLELLKKYTGQDGPYFPVECTGFACTDRFHKSKREDSKKLKFENAVVAGLEELNNASELEFVIDYSVALDPKQWNFAPKNTTSNFPNVERAIQKWANWADNQSHSKPLKVVRDEAVQVNSPLMLHWQRFVGSESWRVRLRGLIKNVADVLRQLPTEVISETLQEEMMRLVNANWYAQYERLGRDLEKPLTELFTTITSELDRQRSKSIERQNLIDKLEACRRSLNQAKDAISEDMAFNHCLLIAGSHGAGKSYFIDQILQASISDSNPTILVLYRSNRVTEESVTIALNRVLETKTTLRAIDRSMSWINGRIVIVIEDLQEFITDDPRYIKELEAAIKQFTEYRSVRFLVTLNETGYDCVSRHHKFWKQYGSFNDVKEENKLVSENFKHCGWLMLDRINVAKGVGWELLKNAKGSDIFRISDASPFMQRQICSPLLASIALVMLRNNLDRTLLGLDYIVFVASLWSHLQEEFAADISTSEAKKVIQMIASVVAKTGRFEISRELLTSQIALDTRSGEELLVLMQRTSLARVDKVSDSKWQGFSEEIVRLQFEVFWCHHLARHIAETASNSDKSPQTAIVDGIQNLADTDCRESVLEQALLLTDTLGTKTKFHWNNLLNGVLAEKSAVYFAASKGGPDRQNEVTKHILSMIKKKKLGFKTRRQLFACMHFIAEIDNLDLKHALLILRGLDDTQPFREVQTAGLGDYFLLVIRRRLAQTTKSKELVDSLPLLNCSDILGFQQELSEVFWSRLLMQTSESIKFVLNCVDQYLRADSEFVSQEYVLAENRECGGRPYFFREYFLSHLFDWLIANQGIDCYAELKKRNWIMLPTQTGKTRKSKSLQSRSKKRKKDIPEIHAKILMELRKRWTLSSGAAYRYRLRFDEDAAQHYRDFTIGLLQSPEQVDCETAYYMIRHTVSTKGGVALVNSCFREALEEQKHRLTRQFERDPIRFLDRLDDDE